MSHPCLQRALFIMMGVLTAGSGLAAQDDEPEAGSILIRNVRLVDRDGKVEDVTVSILIKKGKLDVVTKDEIRRREAALALDAQSGLLFGKLELGQPSNFLILDEDPRDDIDVLLDTATHTLFAIRRGEIVRNILPSLSDVEPEEERKPSWLAYTPPPLALPLSYQDNTKWNRFESKYISGIFLSAIVLDRQRWSQDAASEEQVGDLTEFDGGEIRGWRLGFAGTLNFGRPWVYTVFAATNAFDKGFDTEADGDLTFFDWRLDIPIGATTLSLGKQKEPISMERMMSMVFLSQQERSSVSDALLPSRNVGIVLNGTALGQRMAWAGGVFNDWFDAGQSLDESATQLVGRVTGLPVLAEDESYLIHLGFGMRYSDAKEGVRARTEPEFNKSPLFVDTEPLEADSAMTYVLETAWRSGPLWVGGEYVRSDVRAPALGDPSFGGFHVSATWSITGEMRAYQKRGGVMGPMPVSRSVNQGGWGAWELGARWSDLDLSDGPVEGGEMRIFSLGVNWWLSPRFNVNFNYRHIVLDRFGVRGTAHGLNGRVLLILE